MPLYQYSSSFSSAIRVCNFERAATGIASPPAPRTPGLIVPTILSAPEPEAMQLQAVSVATLRKDMQWQSDSVAGLKQQIDELSQQITRLTAEYKTIVDGYTQLTQLLSGQ